MPHVQVRLSGYSFLSCYTQETNLSKIVDEHIKKASPGGRESVVSMIISENWNDCLYLNANQY
jgi:hypothetical protein